MNKLNTKRKESVSCRAVKSLSNHFIRPGWNDWMAYLPVYLPTSAHSACELIVHESSTRLGRYIAI